MWKFTQEKHHWMFCRSQNRKNRTQWSYQFQMFWSLRTFFSKLCFCKNQLLFVPSSVYAPTGQKESSDACACCSFSIFLPRILGRRRKRTPVNRAMTSALFGLEKRSHLWKKTELFFRKTRSLRLKVQELLPSFLKKIIYGPKVWFKTATIGLPNHSHTPLLNYASCQRCCRQFSHFVENKERGEIPNTQLKTSFRFYCR